MQGKAKYIFSESRISHPEPSQVLFKTMLSFMLLVVTDLLDKGEIRAAEKQ